jgi:hypothetical protein
MPGLERFVGIWMAHLPQDARVVWWIERDGRVRVQGSGGFQGQMVLSGASWKIDLPFNQSASGTYSVTGDRLQEIFAEHGTVESASVVSDKFTGQSRGFGFVEMSSSGEAQKAIDSLNGTQLDGRTLTVNEAKPMTKREGFGGGGGNRGGGGGGRGNRDGGGGGGRNRW